MREERQHKRQELVEPKLQIKERVQAIYSVLSKRDSFEIFCRADQGIDARTKSWQEQGLSKKRYYVRLRGLVHLGLVEKDGGKYKQTPLGRIVFENQVRSLESTLEEVVETKDPEEEFQRSA